MFISNGIYKYYQMSAQLVIYLFSSLPLSHFLSCPLTRQHHSHSLPVSVSVSIAFRHAYSPYDLVLVRTPPTPTLLLTWEGLVGEGDPPDVGLTALALTTPGRAAPKYLGRRSTPFSLWRFIKSSQLLADAPIPGVLNRHNTFCFPADPAPPNGPDGGVGEDDSEGTMLFSLSLSCGDDRDLHGKKLDGLHRKRL